MREATFGVELMMSPIFQTELSVAVGYGTVRCRKSIRPSPLMSAIPRTYLMTLAASVSVETAMKVLKADALPSTKETWGGCDPLSIAVKIVREDGSPACRNFPASQIGFMSSKGMGVADPVFVPVDGLFPNRFAIVLSPSKKNSTVLSVNRFRMG